MLSPLEEPYPEESILGASANFHDGSAAPERCFDGRLGYVSPRPTAFEYQPATAAHASPHVLRGDFLSSYATNPYIGTEWYYSPYSVQAVYGRSPSLGSPPQTQNMASNPTPGSSTSQTGGRKIPLLCLVCPDSPRFSDVSHLLTHIASKGHLHQETQTKLKAHEDVAASIALQQYEQWYKSNGIEVLLVERMRAKQVKQVARNKRSRNSVLVESQRSAKKKRSRRSTSTSSTKLESQGLSPDFPIHPGLLEANAVDDTGDDFFIAHDMLSLKGQVWPGMGKMDLANEDMRRTRNQRKPKSVIERMRRVSEGIAPTQVVLTPEFEVEKVKNVYDESEPPSPDPNDDVSQRKQTRPKRKRAEPLSEISVNIQRREGGRRVTSKAQRAAAALRSELPNEPTPPLSSSYSFLSRSRPSLGETGGVDYEAQFYDTPSGHGHRPTHPTRPGVQMLHNLPYHHTASPTPTNRGETAQLLTQGTNRSRNIASSYFDPHAHVNMNPYYTSEPMFGMPDSSLYGHSSRFSYETDNAHFGNINQDHLRIQSTPHSHLKREDYSGSVGSDSLSNSSAGQFLDISGTNPLISQDRLYLNSYHQPHSGQTLMHGFLPVARDKDGHNLEISDDPRPSSAPTMKLERPAPDVLDQVNGQVLKDAEFGSASIWDPQLQDSRYGLSETIDTDQPSM